MAVITISRSCASMGQEIAEKVAAKLGYKCVSRRVLLEASKEFNTPELLLERALHDAPSLLSRFTHGEERFLAFIRQAFLEQIHQDNVVYHGLAGHFLVEGVKHVLKVRIFADLEERIKQEMDRDGLSRDEARRIIEKDDKARRDWSLALYGTDSNNARLYDLVLHVFKIGVDEAVDIICRTVERPCFESSVQSGRALDNLLMAARSKSAIVEKWPTAEVAATDGNVLIHVDRSLPSGAGVTEEISGLVEPLPGVKNVRVIFYSKKQEVRSKEGMSVVLLDKARRALVRRSSRILVPMANPETQDALFAVAQTLLKDEGGEIVALSVVKTGEQVAVHSALAENPQPIEILDHTSLIARPSNVLLRPVVRVARSLGKGISQAAEEEGCDLIVMGYSAEEGVGSDSLTEKLLNKAKTDLISLKLKSEFPPKRIAVSLAGVVNQNLMVRLAGTLADEFGGEITFLNILPVEYTTEQRAHSDQVLTDAVRRHTARALYRTELLISDDPVDLLATESKRFDLLILGTTKVGLFEKAVVGSFAGQLFERAHCSVAAVRVVSSVRKTLNRVGI